MKPNRPKKYKTSHLHPLLTSCKGNKEAEGILLRKLLIDLRLSQTDLANTMGTSLEVVNQTIRRHRPGINILDRLYGLAVKANLIHA